MQRSTDPRRTCEKKIQYPSRAKARAAKRRTPGVLDVYRCAFCGWYHIGRRLREGASNDG